MDAAAPTSGCARDSAARSTSSRRWSDPCVCPCERVRRCMPPLLPSPSSTAAAVAVATFAAVSVAVGATGGWRGGPGAVCSAPPVAGGRRTGSEKRFEWRLPLVPPPEPSPPPPSPLPPPPWDTTGVTGPSPGTSEVAASTLSAGTCSGSAELDARLCARLSVHAEALPADSVGEPSGSPVCSPCSSWERVGDGDGLWRDSLPSSPWRDSRPLSCRSRRLLPWRL
mmetsp:Transcript_28301/g.91634  ORF Transcript_28301/g.91634 Transcript_28301/m.91634 type:complete len:225 (-) Transcript_28301:378-1052(-)